MRDQDYRRFISLLKFVYGGVSDNFFLKFKAVNLDRDLDRIPKRENVVRPILKELQGTLEVLNNPSLYLPKLASSEAKADFFSLVFSLSYCFSELLALAERARNEYAARLNLSFAILPDVQTLKTGLQTSCGINFSDRAMPGSKGKNFSSYFQANYPNRAEAGFWEEMNHVRSLFLIEAPVPPPRAAKMRIPQILVNDLPLARVSSPPPSPSSSAASSAVVPLNPLSSGASVLAFFRPNTPPPSATTSEAADQAALRDRMTGDLTEYTRRCLGNAYGFFRRHIEPVKRWLDRLRADITDPKAILWEIREHLSKQSRGELAKMLEAWDRDFPRLAAEQVKMQKVELRT